ncbi:MAG: DUF1592 domain-containing protein [Nannocystaceae bacterium]
MRRLNRRELRNALQDLLGVEPTGLEQLPDDDVTHGFDTIELSLSPAHYALYFASIVRTLDLALEGGFDGSPVLSGSPCDQSELPEACIDSLISAFLPRAWRRKLADTESDDLRELDEASVDLGASTQERVHTLLLAALTSPHFLYKVELDADPDDQQPHRPRGSELATRLSLALWSSTPDKELHELGVSGDLQDNDVLSGQIVRMLANPRATTLPASFMGQWLLTVDLDTAKPDTSLFPAFDDELRAAMRTESMLFLDTFRAEGLSLTQLLVADYSFLNQKLANYYGIPFSGVGFERVDGIVAYDRGGFLLQAGALTVSSTSTRTSPVRRGKLVLERLICAAPPPPPDDVADLPDILPEDTTMAEQLAQHREDPVCAGCPNLIDPIGLAFEHDNAIGQWREMENGQEIDTAGELPDGKKVEGPQDLATLIADDPRFIRCAARHFGAYAMGRIFDTDEAEDERWLDQLTTAVSSDGATLTSLVRHVVTSELFRSRRAH